MRYQLQKGQPFINDDHDYREEVFSGAFASLCHAACIIEPIGPDSNSAREWRYFAFNRAMQRHFQVDDLTGQILHHTNAELFSDWNADFERVVRTGAAETLIRQVGYGLIVLQIELSPLKLGGGEAVLAQLLDVTSENANATRPPGPALSPSGGREYEWRRAQANEAQHRVRNLMSMVRSVARLSAPSYLRVDEYVDHLAGRFQALGRTQSMLARLPDTRIQLAELVDEELLANAVNQDQCQAKGPDVALFPHAAEIVTLAIHELATNSIKFGALGDKGDIRISWTTNDRNQVPWLTFSWREASPRRAFIPLRKGFGTCLIEERIAYELGGDGRLQILSSGVHAEFAFPLTQVAHS